MGLGGASETKGTEALVPLLCVPHVLDLTSSSSGSYSYFTHCPQLASMVSYAPLDFDVAAQAAATAAAVAASSEAGGGGTAGTSGEEEEELNESLLRRVLYVSGEEKPEHVRRAGGEREGTADVMRGEAQACEEGMHGRERVSERVICRLSPAHCIISCSLC